MLPQDKDSVDLDIQPSEIGQRNQKDDGINSDKMTNSDSSAISQLAEAFAKALPEHTFSPAEIQGFLLVRKTDPAIAVAELLQWRDDQLRKKSSDRNTDTGDTSSSEGHTMMVPIGDTTSESKRSTQPRVTDSKPKDFAARTEPESTNAELGSGPADLEVQEPSIADCKGSLDAERKANHAQLDECTDGTQNGEQTDETCHHDEGTSENDDDDGVQMSGGEYEDSDDPGSDYIEGRTVMRIWSQPRRGGGPRIIFGQGHSP